MLGDSLEPSDLQILLAVPAWKVIQILKLPRLTRFCLSFKYVETFWANRVRASLKLIS